MAHIRRLPSGRWQAQVWHPSGRRLSRTDPLQGVVKEWAKELERSIARGEYVDPRAGKVTLGEWWERWSATRVVESATTAKDASHWRAHVEPAFGTWPLSSITSWEVEAWAARMHRDKVGAHTRAASVRLLRHLLDEAVRHRILAANPVMVRPPATPKHVDRFLSRAEYLRLRELLPWPHPVFADCLALAGLRWGEAAGLHVQRVDFARSRLEVVEVVTRAGVKPYPKSQAGRRLVPLLPELEQGLADVIGPRRSGLVFVGAQGAPLQYRNWLRRVWTPAVRAASLAEPWPTPHDLRHSYGSWLADEGVPVHDIAALMGHSTLRATERYVHASEARMDRAREALSGRTMKQIG